MKLYFTDRVFSHVCLITQMTNHIYLAVLDCHVANTITTFVYNIWTYIWYKIVANKHLLHIKIDNNYNTATNIFLAAYIKLCYDLCDTFVKFRYKNRVIVIIELLFHKYSIYSLRCASPFVTDITTSITMFLTRR